MIPQSENGQAVAEMVGNSIVYDEFFDENSYLKYTPILAGLKEDIVLESYAENVSYDFLLETDGLHLYNNDKGYYLADVAKEEAIFNLGDVIVYDAIGKPCMGTMEVSTVEEGKKYMLTLSVSDEFLSDPTTEYPVTIDPTITISDNETGTGSIWDAPIFEGYPTKNYGNYYYNSVGTTSSAYGVGRTVVKLPGLYNSDEYLSITDADQIQSVIFGAKDATGGSSQRIYLYPLTENTTWTESNVTWKNVGAYSTALSYSASLKYGQVTEYDITEFAKAWINGEYSATAGFIMINKDESRNRSFCSSEHSTTDYRPYVEMTYTPEISLSVSSKSIVEGGTATLTATTNADGLTVSWSSNNTTVATVSSTGKVTAKKAGTAIITAKITDEDGTSYTSTCTVYVYVPNGVYYIQNMNSGYYLHVSGGYISNLSNVFQYSKYSSSTNIEYRLRQMWKVFYLGNGRYSVRPMHKLDMGLDVTSGNVDIYNIGTTDSLSAIDSYGEWVIEWDASGYVFKNNGNSSLTMQVEDGLTVTYANIVASSYSSTANCRWELNKITSSPYGAMLYSTSSKKIVYNPTAHVGVGETKKLSNANLCAIAYSVSTCIQTFSWTSDNKNVVTVNSSTGAITGVAAGKARITGTAYNGKKVSFDVCVGYPELFNELIDDNILSAEHVDNTDDGFYLCTLPLSTILMRKGITSLPNDADGVSSRVVNFFYDDWYVFAIEDEGIERYGLYKMREQENDGKYYDGDAPGVTISFVALDEDALRKCFKQNTLDNRYELLEKLDCVTGPGVPNSEDSHDSVIQGYFADASSDGAYLIAEKYVAFLAQISENGVLEVPNAYIDALNTISELDELLASINQYTDAWLLLYRKRERLLRIPNALEQVNSNAGYTIYDNNSHTITIKDVNNLTINEKYALLATFTATTTFNSFAAEVEFHAEATEDFIAYITTSLNYYKWYEAALRADITIDDGEHSEYFNDYYDQESAIVQAQIKEHGEY